MLVLDTKATLDFGNEDDIVLDPVWPSAANEAEYWHALLDPLQRMHADFLHMLTSIWQAPNPVVGDAKPRTLLELARSHLDKFAEQWTAEWETLAERASRKFASGAWTAQDNGMRGAFKRAGFTMQFKPTKQMKATYSAVVQQNIGLIRSIPQQYLKDIETQVWNGVMVGSDMNAMFEGIQKVYKIAADRAALIARDQNNKAKAAFERARQDELGIVEAEWQHSGAGQEKYKRPTHVRAGQNRTRYLIAVGWFDPAVNKHIWPGTEINCRCGCRSVIPGLRRRRA